LVANFGLILLCLTVGALLKRTQKLPANAPATLNAFVMTISLPALALLSLHEIQFSGALLYPVSMAWILFILSCVFFVVVGKLRKWPRQTVGALILTGGLGNTSFVGFPLLVALFGPDALKVGVLVDQPGTFLVMASLGLLTASVFATRADSPLSSLPGRLLRFPPFIAMIAGLALHPWPLPEAVREALLKLSAPLIPVALVSVGMQMKLNPALLRLHAPKIAIGLGFKLILAPALITLLYLAVLGARGLDIQITLVEAAMAPMVTSTILADDHGLDPPLANLMLAVGILVSLFTVPLWAYLLRAV
jgi:predicted permease